MFASNITKKGNTTSSDLLGMRWTLTKVNNRSYRANPLNPHGRACLFFFFIELGVKLAGEYCWDALLSQTCHWRQFCLSVEQRMAHQMRKCSAKLASSLFLNCGSQQPGPESPWPPCVADADIIFSSCSLLFFFFFSSPNLSRRRLDVYHTSTIPYLPYFMMWPYCEFRMHVWNVLHVARWKCRTQKIAIWAPSHNFVGLYLRN